MAMEREELVRRLNGDEWNDIEFKEARQNVPKDAYETVSAFANTKGGHLVFGVKQSGEGFEAVGVLSIDKVQVVSTDSVSERRKPIVRRVFYHVLKYDLSRVMTIQDSSRFRTTIGLFERLRLHRG